MDIFSSPLLRSAEEILRARAESLSQVAVEERAADVVSLLLFRLGEEWYATEVGSVREIIQDHTVTPLPGVPEHILGVMNVRGEILSVTDPACLMEVGCDERGVHHASAVVIESDDVATAFVVDEIGDIVEIERDELEPPVSTASRKAAEYVSATACVNGQLVGVIDARAVLEPVVAGARR